MLSWLSSYLSAVFEMLPFFFIGVTTNAGLASIRAWMSVMDLEIWYKALFPQITLATNKFLPFNLFRRLLITDVLDV